MMMINNKGERKMKKGDIVRFKEIKDPGDDILRMELLEDPDGGRVLVRGLVSMKIQPTHVYPVDDLVIAEDADDIGKLGRQAMLRNKGERC
jgi:hypothetical protein